MREIARLCHEKILLKKWNHGKMIHKVIRSNLFIKQTKNLNNDLIDRIKKQILKILDNPFVGKPLKYKRGERSLYIKPFRLIYSVKDNEIILLKFDHRKKVYG